MPQKTSGFSLIELMLALSLSAVLCAGVFGLLQTMLRVHARVMAINEAQEQTRFLSQFLRTKIQMAGDWSCIADQKKPSGAVIRSLNADDAMRFLRLTIKPNTDLLLLQECVRESGEWQYLPVEFFVADTFRLDAHQKNIYALFIKIGHHPREELITNIADFRVQLFHLQNDVKKAFAVRVDYSLGVLFATRRNV